jgi:uncharacterized protein YigE (DUF2233 family)
LKEINGIEIIFRVRSEADSLKFLVNNFISMKISFCVKNLQGWYRVLVVCFLLPTGEGFSQIRESAPKRVEVVKPGYQQPEKDTFPREKSNSAPLADDNLHIIDSLMERVRAEQIRMTEMKTRCNKMSDSLTFYRNFLSDLFEVEGCRASTIQYEGVRFDCFVVDCKSATVDFFWNKNDHKQPPWSISRLHKEQKNKGKILVFAANGGMFAPDYAPKGLYIESGKLLFPLDTVSKGYGNFYLQPNGVFYVDSAGQPGIITTASFKARPPAGIRIATQSGPVLLIDGKINENFTKGSPNLNIRNGVGIIDSSTLVFIISNQGVNFYDFASLFKDMFKCKNALYLDGAISESFIPGIARPEDGRNLGPIIGVLKK